MLITAEHFARLTLDQPDRYGRARLVTALEGLLHAAAPADSPADAPANAQLSKRSDSA